MVIINVGGHEAHGWKLAAVDVDSSQHRSIQAGGGSWVVLVVVDIGGWVTNAGGGAVINAGEW